MSEAIVIGGLLAIFVLLAFLRDHDAPCPVCGYNLRHLTVPRCPECGRELKLSVGATEPYLRGWIALIIPNLLSAGMGVFIILITIMAGEWPERGDRPLMNAVLIFWVANIPIGGLAIGMRRTFMRWTKELQLGIAVGWWLLAVAAFGVFLARLH